MRPLLVVEADPAGDRRLRMSEGAEDLDPDALLLEAAEEALDQAVLLRRVWRDEFLLQSVVAAGGAEAAALEDQSVIAANDRRRSRGAQRSEAGDARLLERSLCFLRATSK